MAACTTSILVAGRGPLPGWRYDSPNTHPVNKTFSSSEIHSVFTLTGLVAALEGTLKGVTGPITILMTNIVPDLIYKERKKHLRGVPTSPWGAAGGTLNPNDFATGPSLSITWFRVSQNLDDSWRSFDLYFITFEPYFRILGSTRLREPWNLPAVSRREGTVWVSARFQPGLGGSPAKAPGQDYRLHLGQIRDNQQLHIEKWTLLKRQTAAAPPNTMLTPKMMK